MVYVSRRRSSIISERSPLEMHYGRKSNYSTFGGNKNSHKDFPSCLTMLSSYYHNITFWVVLIGCIIFFLSRIYDQTPIGGESPIDGEQWDHNHYNEWNTKLTSADGERNLLLIQLSTPTTRSQTEITSRPNRAYARHWSIDYLLHNSDDTCTQRENLLQIIFEKEQTEEEEGKDPKKTRFVYDTVLFLPAGAVITDMEYDLLSLLPKDNLLTLTKDEKLSMFNLRHSNFPILLQRWLDSSTCDNSLNTLAKSTGTNSITILNVSNAGFVVPKLVKLSNDPDGSTVALQTTVDAVCYRYYPWCDVL